jgi:hypothetical protein
MRREARINSAILNSLRKQARILGERARQMILKEWADKEEGNA